MNLGGAIKRCRKEQKMSQRKLAEKTGMTSQALSYIEKNVSYPQKSSLHAIAEALGVSVSYILWNAIEEKDVDPSRVEVYRVLKDAISECFKM